MKNVMKLICTMLLTMTILSCSDVGTASETTFGIPILEAFKCETPVITSNADIEPEPKPSAEKIDEETRFFLLMMVADKKFKTSIVSKQIGTARLSFGKPEYMEEFLDI